MNCYLCSRFYFEKVNKELENKKLKQLIYDENRHYDVLYERLTDFISFFPCINFKRGKRAKQIKRVVQILLDDNL